MADVAQLVRALVCGTRCRQFKSDHPPHFKKDAWNTASFFVIKTFDKIFYFVKIILSLPIINLQLFYGRNEKFQEKFG